VIVPGQDRASNSSGTPTSSDGCPGPRRSHCPPIHEDWRSAGSLGALYVTPSSIVPARYNTTPGDSTPTITRVNTTTTALGSPTPTDYSASVTTFPFCLLPWTTPRLLLPFRAPPTSAYEVCKYGTTPGENTPTTMPLNTTTTALGSTTPTDYSAVVPTFLPPAMRHQRRTACHSAMLCSYNASGCHPLAPTTTATAHPTLRFHCASLRCFASIEPSASGRISPPPAPPGRTVDIAPLWSVCHVLYCGVLATTS